MIFCAHHMPAAAGRETLGQSLYESAVAASRDNPVVVRVRRPRPSRGREPLAREPCSALKPWPDQETAQAPERGHRVSGAPAPETAMAPARGGKPGAARSETAGAGSSPVEASVQGYLSWKKSRAVLLGRINRPSSVRATEVAGLAGPRPLGGGDVEAGGTMEADGDALDGDALDRDGRAGDGGGDGGGRGAGRARTRIGRAVHATLQSVGRETAQAVAADPACDSGELRRIAAAEARAEHIPDLAGEIEQLVRTALSSPTVRAAFASATLRRELYVATRVGGVVLDGFVDLCFEDSEGLVVIDYKTDRIGGAAELTRAAGRHELQAAAYALALGDAAGKPVSRCVLVFLRPQRAARARRERPSCPHRRGESRAGGVRGRHRRRRRRGSRRSPATHASTTRMSLGDQVPRLETPPRPRARGHRQRRRRPHRRRPVHRDDAGGAGLQAPADDA